MPQIQNLISGIFAAVWVGRRLGILARISTGLFSVLNVLLAMMSTTRAAKCSRAIIVHPDFYHSLGEPPQSLAPPEWLHLPRECLLLVASFLAASDLCNLAACNHELKELARDEAVWEALCRRHFSVPRRRTPPSSWRELYKFNHELMGLVFADQESRRSGGLGGVMLLRPQRGTGGGPIRIFAGSS